MVEKITHVQAFEDSWQNAAVIVATDAGRVHIHYRHIAEWIELPPVPGTQAALLNERLSEEAKAFYTDGHLAGNRDRINNCEMLSTEYARMPDPWREGYDAGKGNYPHKFTKEVSTK